MLGGCWLVVETLRVYCFRFVDSVKFLFIELSLIVVGESPEEIWICSMGWTMIDCPGWQKCWLTVEFELCLLLMC